ncbi:MAG: TSUP family transporter [Frankiales bacterium]|nr:TSUP family transporter [Frankiales bacterium]
MIEWYDVLLALGGLVAGMMVGLTGMGGAVLVTPLLVLGFGVPAAAAVSSDVVASAVVKPVGSLVHIRRGTPHWGLALWLSVGSVPGVLLGTLVFSRAFSEASSADTLKTIIGWVLIAALVAMVARTFLRRRSAAMDVPDEVLTGPHAPVKRVLTTLLGLVVGVLVGITSVGSGSLIVTSLLLMYPLLRPSVLVGTDLLQAVPMLVAGAIAHASLGVVDWRITLALLVGQVPGVFFGARLSSRYDGLALRHLLMVVLAATALKLLGVPTAICGAIAVVGVAVLLARVVAERRQRGSVPSASH